MENPVIERFRYFIKTKSKTNKLFCDETGISENTLKSLFQRDTPPTTEVLIKILQRFPDAPIKWILIGIKDEKENIGAIKHQNEEMATAKNKTTTEILEYLTKLSVENEDLKRKVREYEDIFEKINIAALPKMKYGKE